MPPKERFKEKDRRRMEELWKDDTFRKKGGLSGVQKKEYERLRKANNEKIK